MHPKNEIKVRDAFHDVKLIFSAHFRLVAEGFALSRFSIVGAPTFDALNWNEIPSAFDDVNNIFRGQFLIVADSLFIRYVLSSLRDTPVSFEF